MTAGEGRPFLLLKQGAAGAVTRTARHTRVSNSGEVETCLENPSQRQHGYTTQQKPTLYMVCSVGTPSGTDNYVHFALQAIVTVTRCRILLFLGIKLLMAWTTRALSLLLKAHVQC